MKRALYILGMAICFVLTLLQFTGIGEILRVAGQSRDGVAQSEGAGCIATPSNIFAEYKSEGNALDGFGTAHGTLDNGVSFSTGMVGRAFSFDGVDDQVTIPHSANQNAGIITVAAWIRQTSFGHGRPIAQKRTVGNVGGYTFETTHNPEGPSASMQFIIWSGGVPTTLFAPANLFSLNIWYHVAATFDGSNMRMYLNGNEVANTPVQGLIDASNANVVVGRNVVVPAFRYHGQIDELQFYARALSAGEIAALHNAGASGTCFGCTPSGDGNVLWHQAENNTNDSSPAGNNGTAEGSTTFAPGRFGQAYNFTASGAGSVVVSDSSSLDLTDTFTLSSWIHPASLLQDLPTGGIISKVGGGSGNHGYQFGVTSQNTRIYCQFNAPGEPWPFNQLNVDLPEPIPLNAWTHLVCTYDNQFLSVFMNGNIVGSKLIGPKSVANSTSNLRISGDDNGNVRFDGRIDDARVYRRAFHPREVYGMFDPGIAVTCQAQPSLVTVSGRVVTSTGQGLRNATVSMVDSHGVTRTAQTSSFGYFTFEDVAVNKAYVFGVRSRLFRFTPKVVPIYASVDDIDFMGQE